MLTAIILTKNEARHIVKCIDSLRWADRIVVFDSYSDDDTVDLATAAGAQVFQRPFDNYAAQRNAALEAVAPRDDANSWVLFIDADERGTPALAGEIRRVIDERPAEAEAHFALAVLLRESFKDPVTADLHFREYLRLAPRGGHAEEAEAGLLRSVP